MALTDKQIQERLELMNTPVKTQSKEIKTIEAPNVNGLPELPIENYCLNLTRIVKELYVAAWGEYTMIRNVLGEMAVKYTKGLELSKRYDKGEGEEILHYAKPEGGIDCFFVL